MVNAREWLEKEYPLEKRVEITDLKIRSKDLSNCYELTYIECQGNLLTNTDFLAALPSAPKLISLYIGENDFAEQDLNEGLINRFQGSLKHLQNMKNLKKLGIGNTNVDSGLECLAENNERLRNKDSNQKKEIEKLCGELKVIGGELLTRKKKEFEKSAIAEKNQLDEDCQDYLEIFLSAQKGSNIGKLAKKNLLKKIEEKELEELLAKKLEINKLESRLN
ncbi:34518_t:CDS:2, partial [Racocetra persica]